MVRKLLVCFAFLLLLPVVVHPQSPQGSRQIRRAILPDGEYRLVRVGDTASLPFELSASPGSRVLLVSGTLVLDASGTFQVVLGMARVDAAGVTVRTLTKADSGQITAVSVGPARSTNLLLSNDRGTFTLWAARDSLVLRDSDRALLFVRVRQQAAGSP